MVFSLLPSIERARYCWLWLLIGHLPWEVWTGTPIDHCHLSCFFILIYDKIKIQLLHVQISVCHYIISNVCTQHVTGSVVSGNKEPLSFTLHVTGLRY